MLWLKATQALNVFGVPNSQLIWAWSFESCAKCHFSTYAVAYWFVVDVVLCLSGNALHGSNKYLKKIARRICMCYLTCLLLANVEIRLRWKFCQYVVGYGGIGTEHVILYRDLVGHYRIVPRSHHPQVIRWIHKSNAIWRSVSANFSLLFETFLPPMRSFRIYWLSMPGGRLPGQFIPGWIARVGTIYEFIYDPGARAQLCTIEPKPRHASYR